MEKQNVFVQKNNYEKTHGMDKKFYGVDEGLCFNLNDIYTGLS